MANTWQNPSIIAKEALIHMKNNCVAGDKVFRGYEQEFTTNSNGWKKGQSISIKTPLYVRVQDGAVINPVDIYEQTTSMTLAFRKHTAHRITGDEMTYNIDAFSERVIKPNVVALANYVDSTIFSCYKGITNQVGSPGTTPSNYLTYALAAARLDDHGVPPEDRYLFLNPTAKAYVSDQLKGISNPEMAKSIIQKSYSGNLAGFDTYMSQNINVHTCGTAAGLGTSAMTAAGAEEATSLNIDDDSDAWTLTLTEGDIFTVATVNACSPVDGKDLGYLRQFVCSDGTLGGVSGDSPHLDNGTDATIDIPFVLRSSAAAENKLPYQTVVDLPADNDDIVIAGTAGGTYPVNMAWHKNAIALAMVPVEPLPTLKTDVRTQDGYTIRVTIGGDIINYQAYIRFDILFALKVLDPFLGVRIAG